MAESSTIKLILALCNILCTVLAFVAELNGLVNVCVCFIPAQHHYALYCHFHIMHCFLCLLANFIMIHDYTLFLKYFYVN